MIDYDDVHVCGAPYNHQHGAFECGYPLSDGCFHGDTEDDDLRSAPAPEPVPVDGDLEAWNELFEEFFGRGRRRIMTEAEALIMDDWEFEVHPEEHGAVVDDIPF